MKTPDETTKDFLNEQLTRNNISEEYRSAIKAVLTALDKDKKKSEDVWNDFIHILNTHLPDWKSKYPVNNFEYELEIYSSGHLRTVTLNLKSERYSTWVFEVTSFMRPDPEIYFSSILKEMDEMKLSSFDEILPLVEQTFGSDDFRKAVESIQKVHFNN